MKIPLPREHGAWAMLYTPFIVTALVVERFDMRGLWLFIALTAIFLAHEPVALLARIKPWSTDAVVRRRHAVRWLTVYALVGALASLPLLLFYQIWILLPIGFLAMLFLGMHSWLISRKSDRTLLSELTGIVTLTASSPILYYVLTQRAGGALFLLWLIHVLYFISSVFYVKMLVARSAKKDHARILTIQCIGYHAGLFLALALLAWKEQLPVLIFIAFLPLLLRTALGVIPRQNRLNLRKVGYAEMSFTLFFLVVTVISFRL